MHSERILTQAQAESVYSAMCALHSAGGRASIQLPGLVGAYEKSTGAVVVFNADRETTALVESYADQTAFATAYGLHVKEPSNAR